MRCLVGWVVVVVVVAGVPCAVVVMAVFLFRPNMVQGWSRVGTKRREGKRKRTGSIQLKMEDGLSISSVRAVRAAMAVTLSS